MSWVGGRAKARAPGDRAHERVAPLGPGAAILGVLALLGGQHGAWAAFPTRLVEDPVFGLYFAPAKARFETMPLSGLPEPCREKLLADYVPKARLLIYADQTSAGARMLLLGERNGGVLLVARAGGCAAGSLLAALPLPGATRPAPGEAALLTPGQKRQVFGDVLVRYTRAFGGKWAFFAWLDTLTRAMRVDRSLPAELQSMLDAYRRR